MPILKTGAWVTICSIGAIVAFLGFFMLLAALTSGVMPTSYATVRGASTETVAFARDPGRFVVTLLYMGVLPAFAGLFASRWSWRQIKDEFRRPPPER